MSKRLFLIVTLIAVLATLVGTAAVPAGAVAGTKSVKLLSVAYLKEKGITFKFQTSGSFKAGELKGYILTADKKKLNLFCPRKDASGFVLCTAPKSTAHSYGGEQAYVFFGGFSFLVTLPDRPDRGK